MCVWGFGCALLLSEIRLTYIYHDRSVGDLKPPLLGGRIWVIITWFITVSIFLHLALKYTHYIIYGHYHNVPFRYFAAFVSVYASVCVCVCVCVCVLCVVVLCMNICIVLCVSLVRQPTCLSACSSVSACQAGYVVELSYITRVALSLVYASYIHTLITVGFSRELKRFSGLPITVSYPEINT